MFQLIFKNHRYSQPSDFQNELTELPEFVNKALEFCQEWLSGKESFTQHTSGSTGKPKLISLNRQQMLASAKATGAFFKTDSNSKLLCCLNPGYIAGKMMLVRAMVWNCPVLLVEASSDPLTATPKEFEPDFAAMVPLQVQTILEDDTSSKRLQKIKHLLIGGAPISGQLKQKLTEKNVNTWQTYGMTETVSHIALAKITLKNLHYHTLPGVQIGKDSRGALWVKGSMSADEKIQTNDLVDMDSENTFYWLGRTDFVINSGGIKLHPEQLESRIELPVQKIYPGCSFFLTGKADDKLGEKLILLIESSDDSQEKVKLLHEELKNSLNRFEMPKEIHLSKKFSMTPNGKIDRAKTVNIK